MDCTRIGLRSVNTLTKARSHDVLYNSFRTSNVSGTVGLFNKLRWHVEMSTEVGYLMIELMSVTQLSGRRRTRTSWNCVHVFTESCRGEIVEITRKCTVFSSTMVMMDGLGFFLSLTWKWKKKSPCTFVTAGFNPATIHCRGKSILTKLLSDACCTNCVLKFCLSYYQSCKCGYQNSV